MALSRRTTVIRTDVERKILIGMVISTEFLNLIHHAIHKRYFQLEYSKIIVDWVMPYYRKYKQAPVRHIEDMYDLDAPSFKPEMKDLLGDFLDGLSSEYQRSRKFNASYLYDEAIVYFQERSLMILGEGIVKAISAGRPEEAKKLLVGYKEIGKNLSDWINPFDPEFMEGVYKNFLDPEIGETPESFGAYDLFRMPGKLGDLMGIFKRDWLIYYLAPRKRGKTFLLQETGVQAATFGLNVAIFSLEMSKYGFGSRLVQRLVAMGKTNLYYYPCFDCFKNQDGSCKKKERLNNEKITDDKGALPAKFDPEEYKNYKPCTACRGTKEFKISSWFEKVERPIISRKRINQQASGFIRAYGDRMRLKVYPAFSANLKQIMSDLDMLESSEGFVPDVIIIDYADILAPEDKRQDLHTRTDETWKTLKQMAETRHCLVVTASQGNRKSSEKKNVVSNDVGWDITKNDHVDACFALSQTPKEKKSGMIRVSKNLHRWEESDEEAQATILQNLKLSQVILDSEL